jgi:hypothetical protein
MAAADDIEKRPGHRLGRLPVPWLGGQPQQFIGAEADAENPGAHEEKAHGSALPLRLRLVARIRRIEPLIDKFPDHFGPRRGQSGLSLAVPATR